MRWMEVWGWSVVIGLVLWLVCMLVLGVTEAMR